MKLTLIIAVLLICLTAAVSAQDEPTNALTLEPLGTYTTGVFDEGAAEIAAYHPGTQTVYVVNGADGTIDLLDISDPAAPTLITQLDLSDYGAAANSVAVYGDLVAAAVEADPNQEPGSVVFFTPEGEFISQVTVGSLPDMLTFTPDGSAVLTANEGEPNSDYTDDPEGTVSIVDLSGGAENLTDDSVTTLSFADTTGDISPEIRVYGPNATPAQDFEPEYIAVSPDSTTAYVTLQENNAIAVIDIAGQTISDIRTLGFKDFNAEGSGIDAIDDDAINITNYPVFGMYQPDAIAAFETGGDGYLITVNEGDTRDYDAYSEEGELAELTLDETAFPNAAELQETLAELEVVTSTGDTDGDGDFDALYLPGGRSFTIFALDGTQVFESGDALEQITAAAFPEAFNATNDENGSFDDRSPSKGPEPEAVTTGVIGDATYAFIGLERIGGVAVYDVTDPANPVYVTYANNRDFSGDAEAGTAGDLGPESVVFIPAEDSPNGENLLVVANEISGSTTLYAVSAAE